MKRLIAILMCICLIFSFAGCTKIKKEYYKVTYNDNVSSNGGDNSEGNSSDDQSAENNGENSDTLPDNGDNSDGLDSDTDNSDETEGNGLNIEKADEIVDLVMKDSIVFTGNYPDEHNYKMFYVDSENGDDSNNGRSPKKAWQTLARVNAERFEPGTKILLKRGSVFEETLMPVASGKKGKYIIIDAYGEGKKPVIDGFGESTAVLLSNLQYIEIRNLDITNSSEYGGIHNGVVVKTGGYKNYNELYEGGKNEHVYLINLDIHDITCPEGKRFNGGIVFMSNTAKKPAAFNDVLIQGCTVKNTGGSGIVTCSDYAHQPGVEWAPNDFYPSTNISIRNNRVENCASDGIFQSCGSNVLMEHNVVRNTAYADGAYAGMWPHCSRNVVMQYNEVYETKLVNGDGQGFDVDISCMNTVVQYNYSHDNEGGFILICTDGSSGRGYNRDVTVRYNISQNDMGQIFTLSGPISDVKIYNNTVYVKDGLKTNLVGSYDWGANQSPREVRFTNNIFHVSTNGWSSLIHPERITFSNNIFFGSYNYGSLNKCNLINNSDADPKLKAPGEGKIGFDTLDGYNLKSDSPAIDKAIMLNDNGGLDFFGNKLGSAGSLELGAAQFVK